MVSYALTSLKAFLFKRNPYFYACCTPNLLDQARYCGVSTVMDLLSAVT